MKPKWQSTSKKSQIPNLPNQNQVRLSNSQRFSLFIDIVQEVKNDKIIFKRFKTIKKIRDNLNQDRLKTRKLNKPEEVNQDKNKILFI